MYEKTGDFDSSNDGSKRKKSERKPKLIDVELMRTLEERGFKPKNPIKAPIGQKVKIINPKPRKKKSRSQTQKTAKSNEIVAQPNVFTNKIESQELKSDSKITEQIIPDRSDVIKPQESVPKRPQIDNELVLPSLPASQIKPSVTLSQIQEQREKMPVPKVEKSPEKKSFFSGLFNKKVTVPKAFPHIEEPKPKRPEPDLPPINYDDESSPDTPEENKELEFVEIQEPKVPILEKEIETKKKEQVQEVPEEESNQSLPDVISIAPPRQQEKKKKGFLSSLFGNADQEEELEPITVNTGKQNTPTYTEDNTHHEEKTDLEKVSDKEDDESDSDDSSIDILNAKPKKFNN